ncbi:hypothetical protein B4589_004615 [Halolamina sp. CBA1230]|uniref:sacsin N-terminal ATP-binding-like domain-containing protein n=1 Tax=Halolamina sp. CBA1230 TaxID=1853690 RepID=UPI00117AF554|nr:hypothetical protein [Halolamina sp. CBA1230]QKY19696.1 hypothetical protein B4589_004615 [Halolamina sp. CBA1230]
MLRDKVIIGNAERKIAGGHEGREILELLQNARDAIWDGDADQGRVHIGVYDEGVLVANTGSRFDLFDTQVEDAVTMIGETGKGDDDGQSIGHKGVGLKSILATGDSFEIFTRPDDTTDDILGVRLSRSYLVSAILNRLGQETGGRSSIDDLDDEKLEHLLTEDPAGNPIPLEDDLRDSISKLPLFNFPVPLSTPSDAADPIQRRVRELLTETPADPEQDPFRTAVFIRYEDSDWRAQLSALGIPLPDEDDGSIDDRPERIWEYLAAGESDGGLQPETIVQLGGIAELQLERATTAQEPTREERWEITYDSESPTTVPDLAHADVQVRVHSWDSESIHEFDQFRFADPRDHHTAILVNKAGESGTPPVTSYPLYLFYPIEGTDQAHLPFCFHGRFRVDTNRKDLSSNNAATNHDVLEEGLDLIELIGEEVARDAQNPEESQYSDQLPWALLPPRQRDEAITDPTADELITWFQQAVVERLADTPCIPTRTEAKQPSDTILHWDRSVIDGYLAFTEILDALDRPLDNGGAHALPAASALRALASMPPDWEQRVKAVLHADDEQATSKTVLTGWVEYLAASLSKTPGESPAVRVPAGAARSLLDGTVALLTAATKGDESLSSTLQELAGQFDGVYLLPSRLGDADPDDELALVTLEQRQAPSGGQQNQQRVRSVIWDIESETRDVERPPTPPQSSNMTVYFLDERVQEIADVHHVLSTAGRVWGLRAYEGIPSFVRSLLDTFADGRADVVEPIDFAFLAGIIDRVGAESTDLQTGEGSFFPLDYLQTAITQQEGDQRGNLRRRVQLRTCDLHLHNEQPRPITGTVLGDDWQRIRERGTSTDAEDDPTEDWDSITTSDSPAPTWPAPDAATWDVFREQINWDVTDLDFVRTLSLLGTGVLPGVEVLWLYGDEHPSMRRSHDWNPTEWTTDDFAGDIPATVTSLQTVLANTPGYLSLLTSPDHHPQTSADHSRKCDVKLSGEFDHVNVASWVWVTDDQALAEHGDAVRELLRRHGDALDATLLRTGWSCNNGHKRRAWDQSVPSLLNWQLRELDIWDPIVTVQDELADAWGDHASRLSYAVHLESRRGPQAARMFPHIDDASGIADDVLATLGVRSVETLGVTGATDRLQQLQAVLADGELPAGEPTQLWVPGDRIDDWNQAYTQLLQPVLNHLPEDPAAADSDPNWGSLTHLPLRDGDQWVTASIEWIRDHTDEIRYYQDQSPKPWETQAVEDNGYYILPRTASGSFTRLAAVLGVQQLQASKLVFDLDTDDISLVTESYRDAVSTFQRELDARRDLLVASTDRGNEADIIDTADELGTATANLAVAASFPDDATRHLSDPTSALYATPDGDEALLLNASEAGDTLSLDGLAMGLALLFERPTKVATFREALTADVAVPDLETRWAKRTFPIDTVKRVLGSNALHALERDLTAFNDLLDALDTPRVDADAILDALEDADTEHIVAVRDWIAAGERPDTLTDENAAAVDTANIAGPVTNLWDTLPAALDFVVPGLFDETTTHWVRTLEAEALDADMERVVIDWLASHRDALDRPPFDTAARQAYSRFRTVTELWEQTDTSELTDLDTWVTRLRELHTTTLPAWTDTIPKEYATAVDCAPRVVYITINDRVDTLATAFCHDITGELPAVEFDWQSLLTQYIDDGTIPEPDTDTGAKDHQAQAFDAIATSIRDHDDTMDFSTTAAIQQSNQDITVSASSGQGGGGSSQFRGRGQQAEAYVMATVLDRVATWLDNHAAGDLFQLRSAFRSLHDEQQDAAYNWHVESVWTGDLLPLLQNLSRDRSSEITAWCDHVADGTAFTQLPLIQLINVTMERGPGFDIIDPRGPLTRTDEHNDRGLQFTPVEIKAVNGTTPPFRFRLTTNEYRRAKAFVRDGDIPYVIRLVAVPEAGTTDWPQNTSIVAEKIIETEAELNAVVDNDRFETVVKGGYMNMEIK